MARQSTAALAKAKQNRKLLLLAILVLLASIAYWLIDSKMYSAQLFLFVTKLRLPTLLVMVIAAFAIGASTIVFQSIINNRIVTPALLGMSSLYTMVHTIVVFVAGTGSLLAVNTNLAFGVDLLIMCVVAMVVYGYLFKTTNYNILYILLIGTVFSSLFGSVQDTMIRVMDPNEYDALLTTLVADFNNVNSGIVVLSVVLLALVIIWLRKDLALLDVITLGRNQAINLGVDYNRSIRRLLLGVVLAIAISTAMVGPVTFLGLIVANLARQIMKTYRHTYLIAAATLLGMVMLIAGQLIMEHVFSFAVPISTFVTTGGGIYFLYLILTQKGSY